MTKEREIENNEIYRDRERNAIKIDRKNRKKRKRERERKKERVWEREKEI